jgi:hypothetical protein
MYNWEWFDAGNIKLSIYNSHCRCARHVQQIDTYSSDYRDIELDADAAHVVAAAAAEGLAGVIVLSPGHLHHIVKPIGQPENRTIFIGSARD